MKLSTKGRYGVKTMYELALHYGEGPVPLKIIAKNQDISESYLEQLMYVLRNAGYVQSIRGAQGGYTLAVEPEKITLGNVIEATEGPIALVDCLLGEADHNTYCNKTGHCITRKVWAKVSDSISEVLNSISLADLCKENSKEI